MPAASDQNYLGSKYSYCTANGVNELMFRSVKETTLCNLHPWPHVGFLKKDFWFSLRNHWNELRTSRSQFCLFPDPPQTLQWLGNGLEEREFVIRFPSGAKIIIFSKYVVYRQSQWPRRSCWDCGLEFRLEHGYLYLSVVCCQVEVSASGWSLVQRSPT